MASARGINIRALSKQELDELHKANTEAIAELKQDIHLLKRKIHQYGPDLLPSSPYRVIQRPDGSTNLAEVKALLAADLERYSLRLDATAKLTDISIEKVDREVLAMGENQSRKRFSMLMKIFDTEICLLYDIEETLTATDNEPASSRVSWFEVKVDKEIDNAIGWAIRQAAEQLAIHSVLSLIKSYLVWVRLRNKIFEQFTQTHPHLVKADAQADVWTLTICDPQLENPKFILEWGRKIENFCVETDFRLQVEASELLHSLDEGGVLREAPNVFSERVRSEGMEVALGNLITLVEETSTIQDSTLKETSTIPDSTLEETSTIPDSTLEDAVS